MAALHTRVPYPPCAPSGEQCENRLAVVWLAGFRRSTYRNFRRIFLFGRT